jgi:hypothetical protein
MNIVTRLSRPAFYLSLFFIFFISVSNAHAATLTYTNANGTYDWGDASNWVGGVVAGAGDTAIIEGNVTSNTGAAASVTALTVGDSITGYQIYIPITVSGFATFNKSSGNYGIITGNAIYNDTSYNAGTTTGTAMFNTTFYDGTAPTGGIFTFNGSWSGNVGGTIFGSDSAPITLFKFINNAQNNGGIVRVPALFQDSSSNLSVVTATTTFTDTASNDVTGVIQGNAIFNGESVNNDGTITGSVLLNTLAYDSVLPSAGVLTFSCTTNTGAEWSNTHIGGPILGSDGVAITLFKFCDHTNVRGIVPANADFRDYSRFAAPGVITGTSSFSGSSNINPNATITGNPTFTDNADNSGTIIGNPIFVGSTTATNDGTIIGNPIFGGTTYNVGIINGNPIFTGESNNYGGTINGNPTFLDESGHFANIIGDATFKNNSYSNGNITGNAFVYCPSANPIGGTVSGIVTYICQSPAVISAITTTTSTTTATIGWTTDINADSRIDYGTTTGYGLSSSTVPLSTSHSITIEGLSPSMTYHYILTSVNSDGSTTVSSDGTFTTSSLSGVTPPVVSGGSGNGTIGVRSEARGGSRRTVVVAAPISDKSNLHPFLVDLKKGSVSEDVTALQKYLNQQGFILAQTGAGSVGNETNVFGTLTMKALILYQNAHKDDVLTPAGLSNGTGYFGIFTRTYINQHLVF